MHLYHRRSLPRQHSQLSNSHFMIIAVANWYRIRKNRTMITMYIIHIVEDDGDIRKGLLTGLEQEGFNVQWDDNGSRVLNSVKTREPHLMILDIRLPGMDGLSVCRQLRQQKYTFPILMLTARDEEIDRITGLDSGADDYLVKPFSFRELVSRIQAQLRRSYGEYRKEQTNTREDQQEFGNYIFNSKAMRLYRKNAQGLKEELFLTPIELRLLTFFLNNPNQVLNREQIIRGVWGETIFLEDQRTVDVHIRHLREKIEQSPSQPHYIETVRGLGYRFSPDS